MRSLLPLLVAAGLAGCSSTPSIVASSPGVPSFAFDGFPAQSLEGIVYAQAAFDGDYEETFDADLVAYGIVPIQVTMQLRGEGQDNAQILIKPGRMGARLYLLDGTALPMVPADQVAAALKEKAARRVRSAAFQGGLLGPEPTEGTLFFSLHPQNAFRTRGRKVVHMDRGIERELDLAHSLLAFDVTVEDSPTPFFVGIQR